jgi:outer membrane immunogenic protein
MNKFLLAGAAFGALIGPAMASDMLPPRDRVPAYAWNGWYAGLNAGIAFTGLDAGTASVNTFAAPGTVAGPLGMAISSLANFDAPIDSIGFMGGGQVGYNWQFPWLATALVAGIEADIQGLSSKFTSNVASVTTVTPPPNALPNNLNQSASVSTRVDYIGTLRARLGMLVGFLGTTVLYYATGGLAYGGVSASTTVTQTLGGPPFVPPLTPPTWAGSGAFSGTRIGWAAGLGAEWLFFPNWSTSLEYLHYDLGSATYGVSPLVSNTAAGKPWTVNTVQSNPPFNGEIIRAGVNYHF